MRRGRNILKVSLFNCNDTILESTTELLQTDKLPINFQRDMQALRNTAAHYQVVSLSANQLRMSHRVFAILKQPLIQPGQWTHYQSKPQDYELICNPERVKETKLKFKDFEECPSIPGMKFAVWNPIIQVYSFLLLSLDEKNIRFQPQQRTLKGFKARIWDHQARHLDGLLVVAEQISHGEIAVSDDFRQVPAMHQMVEMTKYEIQLMSKQSLKQFAQKDVKKSSVVPSSAQQLPQQISRDLKGKLNKQYEKVKKALQEQSSKEEDNR